MSSNFHSLSINKIKREIPEALSISFEVPALLKDIFSYKAGQYLTLKMDINGNEVRRSYSMSSAPKEDELTITVKRVKGGLVSNYLNETVKEGDSIEVMKPEGRFTPDLNPDKNRSFYLFAGGCGITPLMSILKAVLEEEPLSAVHLLYANRNEDQIIFKEALEKIKERYGDQIVVEHILSQPKTEKQKGLGGFFKKPKMSWTGKVGRLNNAIINDFLTAHPQKGNGSEYFICGPQGLMDITESTLKGAGIEAKNIHLEHFVSPTEDEPKKVAANGHQDAKINITLDGKQYEIQLEKGQTILEAALKNKVDTPFSCQSGACSTCMAKLKTGEVTMDSCLALDDDEVKDGFVLTCQSRPVTPEVEVNFDV